MKKATLLLLVLMFMKGLATYAQCGIKVSNDTTVSCSGSAQLHATPKWVSLNSGTTSGLNAVFFTSRDTGYTVGFNGTILKTTNGGTNWVAQATDTTNYLLNVYFADANNGYAAGYGGVIIKTTNGGNTWTNLNSGTFEMFKSVFFTSVDTGWVFGSYGTILHTTDGGTTWNNQFSGQTNYELESSFFINAQTGFAVGNSGTISKTTDGGTNWTLISGVTNLNLASIYFADANTGYIVGGNGFSTGIILKTINGGANWTILANGLGNALNATFFTDANTGYYAQSPPNGFSPSYLFNTINGGSNWTMMDNDVTVCLHSLYFSDANTGYAVGENGTILKLSIPVSYSWSPATGLNDATVANPVTNPVYNTTTYVVTATSENGCTALDSITVFVNPLIVYTNNTSTTCGTAVTLYSTNNYTGSGTLTYNWLPANSLSATDIAAPSANPGANTTYTVTVTTPNGCSASSQVSVVIVPLPTEQICYVEFDTTTLKNNINWMTNLPANIETVKIYNEVSTNVWSLIGSVPAGQNHFVDINSNPFNQSYSYKISVADTCNIETDSSAKHTTITLLSTYDQGTNTYGFAWSAYQGLAVANYYLYGITATGVATLIGSVLGNQYFYNYTNPYLGFKKYFIGFNTPSCGSKTNHLVVSNFVQAATGIDEMAGVNNMVSIFPNPVTDDVQIQTSLKINKIEITDVTGKLIYVTTYKTIDCSGFAKGVYLLRVKTDEGIAVKRFVKE